MTTHTVRDWRGHKTQLSRCSDDELIHMLTTAASTIKLISVFIDELRDELDIRGTWRRRPLPTATAAWSPTTTRTQHQALEVNRSEQLGLLLGTSGDHDLAADK